MNTRDLRAVETAEHFVETMYRRRELARIIANTGPSFEFSLGDPSPMGFQLERAMLLRGARKDGTKPGRHYAIAGEIPVRDDAQAWHKALGGTDRSGQDEGLALMEAIWQSLPFPHRMLLEWSAGYGDDADEEGRPIAQAMMIEHASRRGLVRGDATSWVKNNLRRARLAIMTHPRLAELGGLL